MASKSNVPVTREAGAPSLFGAHPLSLLQREIDRIFDDFSGGFGRLSSLRSDEMMPKMNVAETDGGYEFTAELPGLEAKDVDVTLADNVLTIRGEKQAEKEEKGKEFRLMERSYGSFSRSFQVPAGVVSSSIKASIDKGVLHVSFPKPKQAEAKKIAVK